MGMVNELGMDNLPGFEFEGLAEGSGRGSGNFLSLSNISRI